MTIEQYLSLSADEWDKITDAMLEERFKPLFLVTRPALSMKHAATSSLPTVAHKRAAQTYEAKRVVTQIAALLQKSKEQSPK